MPIVPQTTFILPQVLDLETALKICTSLAAAQNSHEFIFDFGKVVNVEPSAMLLVSSEIAELRMRFPGARFLCRKHERMTYAGHMGFFKSFGVDFGKHPGQAAGSSSYIPMTLINYEDIENMADERQHALQDEIEDHSKRLAEMLCKAPDGPLFDTLAYSIREIMRNVAEHSKSIRLGICAQYWPSKNKVEVAIVDPWHRYQSKH
jgi:hypothetical protein